MRSDGSGRKRLTNTPRLRKGAPLCTREQSRLVAERHEDHVHAVHANEIDPGCCEPNGSGKLVVVGRGFNNKVDWGTHLHDGKAEDSPTHAS